MRHLSAAAALFLFACAAVAADIHVIALTAGKAVVRINNGRQQTLSAGQVSPEGVRLVEANSESAIFEIDGRRQKLAVEQRSFSASSGPVSAQQAILSADSGGHFLATIVINGASVKCLVDTGASLVTISSDTARRAGINYRAGQRTTMQTANGTTTAYRVALDTVRLNDITLNNVEGAVVEGNVMGELGLLGMSFLNRIEMRREGMMLTLIRRY